MPTPKTDILRQARERRLALEDQATIDLWAWQSLCPELAAMPASMFAAMVVHWQLLGPVLPEPPDAPEDLRVGARSLTGTDCEDRTYRLAYAVLRHDPHARIELEWIGQPPWHVRLVVDGIVIETMPQRFVPAARLAGESRRREPLTTLRA